jgi:hypothetical protein
MFSSPFQLRYRDCSLFRRDIDDVFTFLLDRRISHLLKHQYPRAQRDIRMQIRLLSSLQEDLVNSALIFFKFL